MDNIEQTEQTEQTIPEPQLFPELAVLRAQIAAYPAQKRRARWLMVALTVGGLIVGAAISNAGTNAPDNTAQLTACREALDLATEGFNLSAEGFGIVSEQFTAISNFDLDGIEAGTEKIGEITDRVTELNAPMREKSTACRKQG